MHLSGIDKLIYIHNKCKSKNSDWFGSSNKEKPTMAFTPFPIPAALRWRSQFFGSPRFPRKSL